MTAEVAVINRAAVALAADSVVTISSEVGLGKTYHVNKLFTLSKFFPMGAMVFGNAEFMRVPWETVVKSYRKELGKKTFETTRVHAEDFISWIGKSKLFSESETQNDWFFLIITGYFEHLQQECDKAVELRTESASSLTERELAQTIEEVIAENLDKLESNDFRNERIDGVRKRIGSQGAQIMAKAVSTVFRGRPLTQNAHEKLRAAAIALIVRKNWLPGKSGVVIAGFGEKDAFPSVCTYNVYGIVCGELVFDLDEGSSSEAGITCVVPLAQRDVADSFLSGIAPDDFRTIVDYLQRVFLSLPSIITKDLKAGEEEKRRLENRLKDATSPAVEAFIEGLKKHLREQHTDPLLDVLDSLPKEELAELAESLVSLTSLKRKMSSGIETVGGPIDVAIISRGDGFVWIKRKHYFDPTLNQPFLLNYFER